MTDAVLILGGYGNFGKRIAWALVASGIRVIIAGRDRGKAEAFAASLPEGSAQAAAFDARTELDDALRQLRPKVLVHTAGPFQCSDYGVAESCIRVGVHYIDLADGRDFVTGFPALDGKARAAGVAAVSGASSVPALSSAVVEHFLPEFSAIERMDYGINPGQKAERGLATTQAILGYAGKPLRPVAGKKRYGWQGLRRVTYPKIGTRWLADCDIPDLDLFPARYGIRDIRFGAGLELGFMHLGLWALGWLVRFGLPLDLPRHAAPMLAVSNRFDRFGSADGGMHVFLSGRDGEGRAHSRRWYILAFDGDGPHIPAIPAIVLARKLVRGDTVPVGARACMGLVSLAEYLDALADKHIETSHA